MIYACQDVEFDRRARAALDPGALRHRRGASSLVADARPHRVALLALWPVAGLGVRLPRRLSRSPAGLLVYEHRLVTPDDLSKLGIAFFNVNGYIAVVLFAFTFLGLYV